MVIPKDETARWLIMPISAQAQPPGGHQNSTPPMGIDELTETLHTSCSLMTRLAGFSKLAFLKIINISLDVGYQGKENFTRMRPGQFGIAKFTSL